jgi:type I restriction enzyme, S subunit
MWKTVKLGDICENLDAKRVPITKGKRVPGKVPYYGASGIVDYVEGYIFNENLLLVSEDGANLLARTYPIAFSISGKTWVNNHAHVLRFKDECTRWFIEYYLNSISLSKFVSGMAQPKLNQKMLLSIPVSLPPLAEQKRIVAKLDAAFAEIDKAVEVANAKEAEVEKLKATYLDEQLNKLFNEISTVCLSDVCKRVSVGHVGPTSKYYCDEGIPFIRTQNVSKNGFDDTELRYITREFHASIKKSQLKAGDVLLSRVVIDEMRTAIVPENYGEANCANVILIRPSEKLSPQYLSLLIKSRKSQTYFMGVKKGAAQQVVNTGILKAWTIPLPSVEKQDAFVEQIMSSLKHKDALKRSVAEKIKELANLKSAILAQELQSEAA